MPNEVDHQNDLTGGKRSSHERVPEKKQAKLLCDVEPLTNDAHSILSSLLANLSDFI